MELPEPVTAVIDEAIKYVYSFGPLAEKTVVLGKFFDQDFGNCLRNLYRHGVGDTASGGEKEER